MILNNQTSQIIDLIKIEELIKENNLVFMVGAGVSMSKPSCLPSAKTIMDSLIDFGSIDKYKEIIKNIDGIRYEFIVEQFRNNFDRDLRIINFFIQGFQPNPIHYALAELMIQGNIVMTTNFDTLIEQALEEKIAVNEQKVKLQAIIMKEDYQQVNEFNKDSLILYKLHGSPINYFTKENTKASVITTLDSLSVDKDEAQDFM